MKLLITLFMLVSAQAFAAPRVTCQLEMYQVSVDPNGGRQSWGMAGDSNQKIDMVLQDRDGNWVGTQDNIRFVNDQSQDDTPSRHGVRARVEYSEGSGFRLFLGVLNYASSKKSTGKLISVSATETHDVSAYKLSQLTVRYFNPKFAEFADVDASIPDLVRAGKLANGDLIYISATGCRMTK